MAEKRRIKFERYTNLPLGGNWAGERPAYVLVHHEGSVDDVTYVPERTCRVECYPPGYEDNLHYEVCSECGTILTASKPGDRHAARASYCPSCGARIVKEEA